MSIAGPDMPTNMDETEYFLASEAMKEYLDKAMEQEKNGEGIRISLEDISH
jgi:hypothetical protein